MNTIEISDEVMDILNKECRLGESANDVLLRLLPRPGSRSRQLRGSVQDKASGIAAYEFGHSAALAIADQLGAEPVPDDPANMFFLDGIPTLIKTRRQGGGVFSIPKTLFERFKSLIAAVETSERGVFDLYLLAAEDAKRLSYEGRGGRNQNQLRLAVNAVKEHGEKQGRATIPELH